jgi:hypothetical protein
MLPVLHPALAYPTFLGPQERLALVEKVELLEAFRELERTAELLPQFYPQQTGKQI